jgi:hypothetical protein
MDCLELLISYMIKERQVLRSARKEEDVHSIMNSNHNTMVIIMLLLFAIIMFAIGGLVTLLFFAGLFT